MAHWFDHMTSSLEASLETPTDTYNNILGQLQLFLEGYGSPAKREFLCNGQSSNVAEIFRCIPQDAGAWTQWFDLEWKTSCLRKTIESLRDERNSDETDQVLMEDIYGLRRLKCSRIACDHFATGFDSKLDRDEHINRHDRPFVCMEQHCPFQALGFETKAQLDSHLARNHIGDDADKFLFPQPSRRKDDNIHKASARGDVVAVKNFLDGGARINTPSRPNGAETPLFLAARNSHLNICKTLLENGADVNFRPKHGSSVSTALQDAVTRGDAEMVHLFLSLSNVLPDQRNKYGQSALHLAVMKESEAVIHLLLATGKVDAKAEDAVQQTPLFMAVKAGAVPIVKLLLATGEVDPNTKDEYGRTPLYMAVKAGAVPMVKLLLASSEVDPDAKDEYGRTLFSKAAGLGVEPVMKSVLETGSLTGKVDPVSRAVLQDQHHARWQEKFHTLQDYQMQIMLLEQQRKRRLQKHIEQWRVTDEEAIAVMNLLLATDRVNPDTRDNYGRTPLMIAVEKGSTKIVEMLLATDRVDPDTKNNERRTPLIIAVEKGLIEIVKMLLATGRVDPAAEDKGGNTPLSRAVEHGDTAVVTLLSMPGEVSPDEESRTLLSGAAEDEAEPVVTIASGN